jgi:transitional endoplasmic reticulum ATPase
VALSEVDKAAKAESGRERIPAWAEQLRLKFRACVSHVFLLTGNVRDIVSNRMTLDAYLAKMFLTPTSDGVQHFDMVIFYDRANGIHFPLDEMKTTFLKEAEVDVTPKATAGLFKPGASAGQLPRDPAAAFDLIEKVLKSDRKNADGREMHSVFVMDYAESLLPSGTWASMSGEDRHCVVKVLNWARDTKISANANAIILIADSASQVNEAITASASRIEMMEILLPSPEERKSFIDYLDSNERQKPREGKEAAKGLTFEKGFDARKYAHLSAGLKKLHIEDIKLTAMKRELPISADLVKQRKKEIYEQEYQSQLEVIDPEHGFEVVGGMEWLKDYLISDVVTPMLEGDTTRCPMGILFTGPAGTGKTILATALAYEAHMNMVRLDVGKLLGSLVGASEHNMARALLAIRSLVPVLVFLDEIDQSVSRGSHGDSGVSNRMFQALLQFLSDTTLRGKVLAIAATNRPDMMDSALKRRGRFDKIIPFLPPDTKQRADIFPAVLRRYEYKTEGEIDFEQLAIDSKDWVGSDIEAGVVKAYQIARRNGRQKITQEDIALALKKILPARHDVELWANLALLDCSDVDLLPPSMRDTFMKDRVNLEAKVKKGMRESLTTSVERSGRDIL